MELKIVYNLEGIEKNFKVDLNVKPENKEKIMKLIRIHLYDACNAILKDSKKMK